MSAHSGEIDVRQVGCPFCGASSHEPCWSDEVAGELQASAHLPRIRLAFRTLSSGAEAQQ